MEESISQSVLLSTLTLQWSVSIQTTLPTNIFLGTTVTPDPRRSRLIRQDDVIFNTHHKTQNTKSTDHVVALHRMDSFIPTTASSSVEATLQYNKV
jgi:hypothetical protein